MGYYTNYKLEVQDDVTDFNMAWIEANFKNPEAYVEHRVGYEYAFGNSTKWYDYDIDMRRLSNKFPKTLFIVSGEGEENGDIWKHYFKDGKDHKITPVISWPEFDEKQLT